MVRASYDSASAITKRWEAPIVAVASIGTLSTTQLSRLEITHSSRPAGCSRGDVHGFAPHICLHRVRDEALLMSLMVHGFMLGLCRSLVAREDNSGPQSDFSDRRLALSVLCHHTCGFVTITVDHKA